MGVGVRIGILGRAIKRVSGARAKTGTQIGIRIGAGTDICVVGWEPWERMAMVHGLFQAKDGRMEPCRGPGGVAGSDGYAWSRGHRILHDR